MRLKEVFDRLVDRICGDEVSFPSHWLDDGSQSRWELQVQVPTCWQCPIGILLQNARRDLARYDVNHAHTMRTK